MLQRALPAVVAATLATACGGVENDPDPHPGSGGAGTATSGTGATGGEADACVAWNDQTGVATVTFRVVNQTPQDIFMSTGCFGAAVDVIGDDGQSWGGNPICGSTCEDLRSSPPVYCAPCLQIVVRVPAGGAHELSWSGADDRNVAMPTDCYQSAADDTGTCRQVLAAPAQQYVVSLAGYGACDDGGAPCACNGDECTGVAGGQQVLPETTAFPYPAQTAVDVIFAPCAFGCPDGPPATPASPDEE